MIRVSLSLSVSNFNSQPSLSRHQLKPFSSTVLYQKIGYYHRVTAKRQRSSKKNTLSIILEKVLLTSTVFLSLVFPLLLIQSSINLSLDKVLLCFICKKMAGGQGGGKGEWDQTALTSSICNLFYSFFLFVWQGGTKLESPWFCIYCFITCYMDSPGGASGKEPACQCRRR